MLKCKVLASGYHDSSNDDNGLDGLKRPKPVPYAPPRLTTTSRSGSGTFQLPGSSGSWPRISAPPSQQVSISSSSGRPTPVPESVRSVRNTPEIHTGASLDPTSRGSTAEPSSVASLRVPEAIRIKSSTDAYRPNSARSSLTLEGQINELAGVLEEYKHTSEERQKTTDNTLSLILETLNRLESTKHTTATSQALTNLLPTVSNSSNAGVLYSNPVPTPELIAIISKVVSEARSRVGKKKGGADDNSCKEHARTTFYRMLGITAAREVRPYFEDEYGEPDTLPAQFVDPDSGYCQPYPHWKAPLTKQAAWVPTFILRFKSTIPNGQSELSNVLQGLSDELITTLLHDGPFKLATTAWRDAKKSDAEVVLQFSSLERVREVTVVTTELARVNYIKCVVVYRPFNDSSFNRTTRHSCKGVVKIDVNRYYGRRESVEAMRSSVRRYQRCDRKAAVRSRYIKTISSLQSPDWEYLSHPEYMSQDESDDKGALTTKQPENRAQWRTAQETNLYDAIFVAERVKASVELVKHPIPHLERGTGSGKVTIRIAICGLSNTWRQQHPDDLRKYTPFLNMKAMAKPDISSFLEQHPLSTLNAKDESSKHIGELGYAAVKLEGSLSDEEDATGAGHDPANRFGAWQGLDYNGEGESGAILDMGNNLLGYGTTDRMDRPEVQEPTNEENACNSTNVVIDPQLIAEDAGSNNEQRVPPDDNITQPCYNFEMPPPPLLVYDPYPITSEVATSNDLPAKGKARKAQVKKSGSVSTGVDQPEEEGGQSGGVVHPKRRGRPLGSKNKPKT
ncbi:hypothetical protein BDV93DRAFT_515951 [Ceratobasidium sp. AG-I]|nr:hypothetical protein BDV93DRAFT_515951 [Ceratobasidium sp. AG-I]